MNSSGHDMHTMMDHSAMGMNHSGMDHAAMGHMDHSAMDHAAMSHMDHSAMDHAAMGHMNHSAMDHAAMGHMDHSAMDHAAMGHGDMDHSDMHHMGMDFPSLAGDHSAHAGMGHSMSMTFHFGSMETVLFSGWQVKDATTMVFSCVGIFIIAALYEGIKYYRENLLWKTYNAVQYRAVAENTVPDSDPQKVVVQEVIRKNPPNMCSPRHLLQTGLHVVQLSVSYLLMLIFMTYNVWLCLAVVAGSGAGYFMFGWKRRVVVDMTETCH